jgi:hypothetical protein
MKRLIPLFVVMAFAITARATNTITLSSASGHPGDEVTVMLSLTGDDAVTAVDVSIPLTKYTSYVAGSAQLVAERSNGHSVSAATTDGALRILVYNFTSEPLKGDGDLLTFKLLLGKEPADYALKPQNVTLSDAAGKALEATASGSTVTLLSPKLQIDTQSIDFGRSAIRGTYTRTLRLSNVGNEPLNVSAFKSSAAELTVSPESGTIAAGSSGTYTITYSPVTRAAGIEERISVESDAVNGTKTATVTAIPFSVNELHVSSTEGDSDSEVTISLTMNNMEPIVSAQCSFQLPDALKYVDGSATAGSRTNGHSVSARCTDDGELTLFMISMTNTAVSDNDGEILSFKVRLDGKSGYYYLTPQKVVLSNITSENMVSDTSSGRVHIKAPSISCNSSIDMGQTAVTEGGKSSFTIRNNGQVALTVSRIIFADAGFSVAETLPLTVAVGSSQTVTVLYDGVAGDYSTTMNVYSNDPDNRLKTVAVSGSLYEPNSLSLSGEPSADYQTITLHFDLSNYTDIVAMQLDIHGPAGMTASADGLVLSERASGHSASISSIDTDVHRVVIFSLSNRAFTGNSGRVFDVTFTGASCLNGKFVVDNIKLSNVDGIDYTSPDATINFEVPLSTGVGDLQADGARCAVYTIGGVLLNAAADSAYIAALPAGIYIVNGKKYVSAARK